MPTSIITCQCKARIKVPSEAIGKTLRCPRCKEKLVIPSPLTLGSSDILTSKTLAADAINNGVTECSICQTAIGTAEPTEKCHECHQSYHKECWQEIGGCGTYGCNNAHGAETAGDSNAPLTAWGDTKKCPACQETIKSIAIKCRYCHTEFSSVDPLSVKELRNQSEKVTEVNSSKTMTIVIFVLSALGLFAPIMLIVGLLYKLRREEVIKNSGPLYVIMGWVAVALSAMYSLLILFFLLLDF